MKATMWDLQLDALITTFQEECERQFNEGVKKRKSLFFRFKKMNDARLYKKACRKSLI